VGLNANVVAAGLLCVPCRYFDSEGNMKELGTEQLCKGKKVVLFAVPGAFTPTCSMKHLPGFIEKAEEIKVGLRVKEGGVRVVSQDGCSAAV
jgi:peroxiredoxin